MSRAAFSCQSIVVAVGSTADLVECILLGRVPVLASFVAGCIVVSGLALVARFLVGHRALRLRVESAEARAATAEGRVLRAEERLRLAEVEFEDRLGTYRRVLVGEQEALATRDARIRELEAEVARVAKSAIVQLDSMATGCESDLREKDARIRELEDRLRGSPSEPPGYAGLASLAWDQWRTCPTCRRWCPNLHVCGPRP